MHKESIILAIWHTGGNHVHKTPDSPIYLNCYGELFKAFHYMHANCCHVSVISCKEYIDSPMVFISLMQTFIPCNDNIL